MSTSELFIGFGLTVLLAVACQIVAARYRLPAIVLLLPTGFLAGRHLAEMNPERTLGPAFSPLVGLAVAIILFDGGLDLRVKDLEGHSQRVVRRLLYLGIPMTWAATTLLALPLFGVSGRAAIMLGAILIVSGPTVVAPLLEASRPGRRVSLILGWEGTTIDPIGAVLGALVFTGIINNVDIGHGADALAFLRSIGLGLFGGAIGTAVLWLLLSRLRLTGVLATEAIVATVIGTAALCNARHDDTGLLAAIFMGVALANLPGIELPEDRRFFKTIVQLVIGVLFISISASVTTSSVKAVFWPALGLIAGLVALVRPSVAAAATLGTSLSWRERAFIGWMDPRGIVAASTAATFAGPLTAAGIGGADKLLPVTFLVIVGTVLIYGFSATPVARLLGLADSPSDAGLGPRPPDEPDSVPPPGDE